MPFSTFSPCNFLTTFSLYQLYDIAFRVSPIFKVLAKMSAEVESMPQNGALEDDEIQGLNGAGASDDDADLFGDDDEEPSQHNGYEFCQ